jgi:hypothetical protein
MRGSSDQVCGTATGTSPESTCVRGGSEVVMRTSSVGIRTESMVGSWAWAEVADNHSTDSARTNGLKRQECRHMLDTARNGCGVLEFILSPEKTFIVFVHEK